MEISDQSSATMCWLKFGNKNEMRLWCCPAFSVVMSSECKYPSCIGGSAWNLENYATSDDKEPM